MLKETDYIDLSKIDKSEYGKYFGKGYRYCCYTTDKKQGIILFFGYDTKGNPQNFRIPHMSHLKYTVKYDTKETDIFGRNVETKYFRNTKERMNYVEKMADKTSIIECLPPQNEFLHEYFDEYALDEDFNTFPLRIQYYDIETEISDDGFEEASNARQRINMITIYDTKTEKFYTWSLQPVEPDFSDEYDENGNLVNECCLKDTPLDKFVLFDFFNNSEMKMLKHFLEWFENNTPDVFCGFNSQAFDLGYILNRIERVLGDDEKVDEKNEMQKSRWSEITRRFSPVGKIRERHNNLENERANKQAEFLYDVDGIFSADLMVLYRDKFKINQPLDGGNGLDNIGEVECGIHKIHYKGTKAPNGDTIYSLKDLYLKDWNRFYKYNVMDVEVLRRVEEKVKTIPLSRAITSAGLSNYDAIYSSIGYLVGSLIMFSKTQLGTTFTSYVANKKDSIPYEGAFVFDVTPGLYSGGVATVDFNSLYPSSIRAMNLSPETYVGKISRYPIEDATSEFFTKEPPIDLNDTDIIDGLFESNDEKEYGERYSKKISSVVKDSEIDKFYILPANGGKQKVLTRKKLDELLNEKCIFTRNNTLFLKHSVKQGVVSGWCKHFYALRKKTKKLMQKLEMDVYKGLVSDENKNDIEKKIANLNDRQQSIKIMINSIYGICGTSFSPIYNPYVAQSITRTGKFCNLSAAKYISIVFRDRYKLPDSYVYQNGGDTDSQFLNIKCVTDFFKDTKGFDKKISNWTDDQKLELWNYMDDFVENDLNKFVQNHVENWYKTEHPEVLRYSMEYIGDVEIMESKKHYALHKILSEGPEIVNKIKYSGIELKKASVPKKIKEYLGEIYKSTLTKDWNDTDFRDYINKIYPEFEKLDINDIALWKGYNTGRESNGFLQMEKGATGISKAVTFFNQLIGKEGLNIGSKYDTILLGDKVRFCYIKPGNKYGINVIAFKDGQYPDEFRNIFEIDYVTMFDKLIVSPLKNFLVATKFKMVDPTACNIIDVDDL